MGTESTHTEQVEASPLLELVEQLQQFGGGPQEFLHHLLTLQCQIASAKAGALLRVEAEGRLEVLAVYPIPEEGTPDPVWLAKAAESTQRLLESPKTMIVPMHASEAMYGQESPEHLVLIPVRTEGVVRGVAGFLLESYDRNIVIHARDRLELSTSLLSMYEMRQTLEKRNHSLRWLRESMEILARTNEEEKFRAAAMSLCNELATRRDARRVSLGILRGRYVTVQAISHTENFTRKMRVVQDVEAAMEECLDQDCEVVYPAPVEADYVSRAAAEVSRRHGPSTVCSVPFRSSGEPFGVLTVEIDADQSFTIDQLESLRLTCDLCAARIHEQHDRDRWMGVRFAKALRKGVAVVVGPRYTWVKVASIAATILLGVCLFVEGDDNVRADFEIHPVQQQLVPAPFDGRLSTVHVKKGSRVEAGSTILATFDTYELELERLDQISERDAYRKEAKIRLEESKPQEAELARLRADQLDFQIQLLNYQISSAKLTSPIEGVVVSEDLKKLLQAPFGKGDPLFEIAKVDRLRAELQVPEARISDLKVGQVGKLAAASHPDHPLAFRVDHISPVATVVGETNAFLVRVEFIDAPGWIKPGMSGTAKVQVGQAVWGKILTRDVVNWIKMQIWMRKWW